MRIVKVFQLVALIPECTQPHDFGAFNSTTLVKRSIQILDGTDLFHMSRTAVVMRHIFILAAVFSIALIPSSPACFAQSTISDEPVELNWTGGLWAALLPSYELGSGPSGPALRDDMDDLGTITQLQFIRRFLGTRTSFEVTGFYAEVDSVDTDGTVDVNIPNPVTGAGNALTGGNPYVKSDTDHYGVDVALRDTWRTRFGGLSAGCSFSYMTFDQQFDVNYSDTQLFQEQLDSDFRGGKAFVGWDGCLMGQQSMLDIAVGIYDLNMEYEFQPQTLAGNLVTELQETTTTIETSFKTRRTFAGYLIGVSLGAKYFADMPQIDHTAGSAATLTTDDAVTLSFMLDASL